MSGLARARWALAQDVELVAVRALPPAARARLGAEADGAVISRRGGRAPAQLIDAALAALLGELTAPTRVADAVLRYARARGLCAERVLDEAIAGLAALARSGVLVPEADGGPELTPTLAVGAELDGLVIVRQLRLLFDSELLLARTADGRLAALKLARPQGGALVAEQLQRETELLRALELPQVPRVVAAGAVHGCPYLATEWRAGRPLSDEALRLRLRDGALGRAAVHELAAPLARAFAALHERGVVHGDVHPGNVLFDRERGVTVLDFGLARWLPDERWRHAPRSGALPYLDPAAVRASAAGRVLPEADEASDVYALAVLVYEAVTGHHPWALPATRADALTALTALAPRRFAQLGLPSEPALEAPLRRALGWPDEPGEPAPTARALDAALARWTPAAPVRSSDTARLVRTSDESPFFDELQRRAAAHLASIPLGDDVAPRALATLACYRAALLLEDPLLLARAAVGARHLARAQPRPPAELDSRALADALDALAVRKAVADALADPHEARRALAEAKPLFERALRRRAALALPALDELARLAWATARLVAPDADVDAAGDERAALRAPAIASCAALLEAAPRPGVDDVPRPALRALWASARLAQELAGDAPQLLARATAALDDVARRRLAVRDPDIEPSAELFDEAAGWAIAYEACGASALAACAERAARHAPTSAVAPAVSAHRALDQLAVARAVGSGEPLRRATALARAAFAGLGPEDPGSAWAALAVLECARPERSAHGLYSRER